MIPIKLLEPIAELVCKIMKLSLHFCEFINVRGDVFKSQVVHCDNIWKQRAGKYRVIYIHKRKKIRIFLEVI